MDHYGQPEPLDPVEDAVYHVILEWAGTFERHHIVLAENTLEGEALTQNTVCIIAGNVREIKVMLVGMMWVNCLVRAMKR